MAIQKVSGVDKGSLQAVSGVAKTSIQAISGTTALFVTYDSVAEMGTGSGTTIRGPRSDEEGDNYPTSTEGGYRPVIAYDTNRDRVVVGWQDLNSPNNPQLCVGKVANDGSVTWGSIIEPHGTNKGRFIDIEFNPNTNKIQMMWNHDEGSDNYDPYGATFTINDDDGTDFLDGDTGTITNFSGSEIEYGTMAYDEDTESMYICYKHGSNVKARQFLDDCSDIASFDPDVPWDENNTQTYPTCTYAKSINRLLVACNDANTGHANCITLNSGDGNAQTVTLGDDDGYEFMASQCDYIDIAWDETVGKGLLVFRNGSAGKYQIFTVDDSDNSIAFPSGGSSAGTFESGDVKGCSVTWNENEGHFLIIYIDDADSDKYKLVKATVNSSDDNVAFGSILHFSNSSNSKPVHNFNTKMNHTKTAYLPDTGAKGIMVAVIRDHYSDIDAYRLSAQGTDYTNDV